MKSWLLVLVFLVLGTGYWIYKAATTPAPGQKVPGMGREHVTAEQVSQTTYNSNPPTSGPHLATSAKAGVYTTPLSDGELIHSMEHGYVIISYNCNVHLSKIFNFSAKGGSAYGRQFSIFNKFSNNIFQKVYAHEEESSPGAQLEVSAQAIESAVNDSDACKSLIKNLEDLANKKRLWKLIVVPRLNLDTTIALTAWGYIDKFDPPAGGFDVARIEKFIDYHRDHGPEKTAD